MYGWRSFLVQVPLDGLLLLAGTNFWSSRRTSRCLLRRRSISAGQRANSGTLAGTLRASHKTSATESNIQPTHPKLRQRQVRSLVAPSLAFRALKRLRSSEIGRFRKIGLLAMFPPPPATAWVRPTHRGFSRPGPRLHRRAAPLDVVHTFIWPDLCVGKKHRPLTRYGGQTARPPSTERQPSFTQTRL